MAALQQEGNRKRGKSKVDEGRAREGGDDEPST